MENDPRFNAIATGTCPYCGEGYVKSFIGEPHLSCSQGTSEPKQEGGLRSTLARRSDSQVP